MGRYGKGPQTPQQQHRTVDTTGTAHLVTVGAAAGEPPRGRYPAICGEDALVARQARYRRLCAPIPAQRSRGSRDSGRPPVEQQSVSSATSSRRLAGHHSARDPARFQ